MPFSYQMHHQYGEEISTKAFFETKEHYIYFNPVNNKTHVCKLREQGADSCESGFRNSENISQYFYKFIFGL